MLTLTPETEEALNIAKNNAERGDSRAINFLLVYCTKALCYELANLSAILKSSDICSIIKIKN